MTSLNLLTLPFHSPQRFLVVLYTLLHSKIYSSRRGALLRAQHPAAQEKPEGSLSQCFAKPAYDKRRRGVRCPPVPPPTSPPSCAKISRYFPSGAHPQASHVYVTTDTRGWTSETLVTIPRTRTSCPTAAALTWRNACAFMVDGDKIRSSYLREADRGRGADGRVEQKGNRQREVFGRVAREKIPID